jgi:hypothetical protein
MPRIALVWVIALVLTAGGAPQAPPSETPTHTIASEQLRLTLYLPDAEHGYYRGARFDWAGMIAKAEWNGHALFADWKTPHRPDDPEGGIGPCEEFGMTSPLGYDDASVGGTFVKIGVGELRKAKNEPYRFNERYQVVRPGAWTVDRTAKSITFTQELSHPAGWGYRYTKTIAVADELATFVIRRTLVNTGSKAIETDQYNHNFFSVNGDPIGPNYQLRFGFSATLAPGADLRDAAKLDAGVWTFPQPLTKGTAFATLVGYRATAADHAFTLEHTPSDLALRVTGDKPLSKFNVWCIGTAACPEPYVEIKLAPKQECRWTSRYELRSLTGK